MTIFLVSLVPNNLLILATMALLSFCGLIWYALYKKGYVLALFSHGRTVFKLEARERDADRDGIKK